MRRRSGVAPAVVSPGPAGARAAGDRFREFSLLLHDYAKPRRVGLIPWLGWRDDRAL